MKKTVSLLLTLVMTFLIIVPFSLNASALGGVQAKLNEVMKEFPPVTKQGDPKTVYFTVSGKPSESVSSKDCYYPDVAKAHGYKWDNMWPSYSCCGFVHFVFRYIFGVEFTWEDSVTQTKLVIDKTKDTDARIKDLDKFFKKCKVGDAILFNRPSTHYVIFVSYDANAQRVLTYDCGWDQECAVKTLNRSLTGMKDYDSIIRYRAKNYDKVETQYGLPPTWEYNVISKTDKTIEITGYSEDATSLNIPTKVDGYKVVRIADNAFKGTSLKSVSLPNTLTSIGSEAFYNTPLFYTSFKDDAVYIGDYLIYVNTYEEIYKVNAGTVLIADDTFNAYNLDMVIIPKSMKYISDSAFSNTYLTKIMGYKGSTAEKYASDNFYEFIPIDGADNNPYPTQLGDVNGDDRVTLVDAKWILQSIADIRSFDAEQEAIADVNQDGSCTLLDAKWVLQFVAGQRELGYYEKATVKAALTDNELNLLDTESGI